MAFVESRPGIGPARIDVVPRKNERRTIFMKAGQLLPWARSESFGVKVEEILINGRIVLKVGTIAETHPLIDLRTNPNDLSKGIRRFKDDVEVVLNNGTHSGGIRVLKPRNSQYPSIVVVSGKNNSFDPKDVRTYVGDFQDQDGIRNLIALQVCTNTTSKKVDDFFIKRLKYEYNGNNNKGRS